MTVASKLFYHWRSRGGRNPEPDSFYRDRDPSVRRPHPRHDQGRRCHRREDSDSSPHLHHHAGNLSRRASHVEHDHRSSGEFGITNITNEALAVSAAGRLRLTRNDRLPDAVLQARERLIERLKSVSLVGRRQTSRVSGISCDEFALSHDFRINDFGDQEAETLRDWSDSITQHAGFSVEDLSGIRWETLSTQNHEVFRASEENRDSIAPQYECCICLECFNEGDGLIRLHCGHKFHPFCLKPWVQTCSDCPYCRATVMC